MLFVSVADTVCNLILRRKHMLRHVRPFRCEELGCTKKDGFTSQNDLDRHKKSVHKIDSRNPNDKTYMCAAPHCSKKAKIWPRGDNFRQHCIRIHPDSDTAELMDRSVDLIEAAQLLI